MVGKFSINTLMTTWGCGTTLNNGFLLYVGPVPWELRAFNSLINSPIIGTLKQEIYIGPVPWELRALRLISSLIIDILFTIKNKTTRIKRFIMSVLIYIYIPKKKKTPFVFISINMCHFHHTYYIFPMIPCGCLFLTYLMNTSKLQGHLL